MSYLDDNTFKSFKTIKLSESEKQDMYVNIINNVEKRKRKKYPTT